ncbi:MAG: hypothetical protein K5892_02385 [Acholeplasmatales bacterium]|nr:hypothetical protein [Acholeplasmatales bacterium]
MKKNYISLAALTGVAFLGLVSCKDDKKDDEKTTTSVVTSADESTVSTSHFPTDTTTSKEGGTASLKVIDFDGEVVFEDTVNAGDTLYNVLINTPGIELVSAESQYGHMLQSINGTIMDDPNLSLMIYENGQFGDGVDILSVDNGDIIEIRNEFWNTKSSGWGKYDDVDVLVDKTIYKYIKTAYKDVEANYTDVLGSSFWEYLLANLAIENGYDVNIFNLRNSNQTLINQINNYDYSKIGYKEDNTLEDYQFFKFYYTGLQTGAFDEEEDLNRFKSTLKTYADANVTNEYEYNQYTSSFILSLLNKLEINKDTLKAIASGTDKLDVERGQWGNYTDQLAWQVLAFDAIQGDECKFDDTVLNSLNVRADEFNCTSLTASVAAFAALGVNPRDTKYEINGEDIIENILDNFYDEESGLLKIEKTDTTIPGFSTNQIYAYLFAYKISRDKQDNSGEFAKFNLFA